MSALLMLPGIGLLALAAFDAAVTTISTTSAAGPVTSRIGRGWWRAAHRLARRPASPILTSAGPVVLVLTVSTWLVLLWAGWTLVFSADATAVVSSETGRPADLVERAYFAGFATFTLGVGDFVPAAGAWQLLTILSSVTGLALATAAVTYLVPVVTAATQRSAQAATISSLGGGPTEIVGSAFHEGSVRYLEPVLIQLTGEFVLTAERLVAYPILHYFHPRRREVELRVQLAVLDDALDLVEHGLSPEIRRPHPAAISGARWAMIHLVERSGAGATGTPAPLTLDALRTEGIPVVDDETFAARLESVAERRATLSAYADESGWTRSR